jgi:SAM-dependent methyltransferase
MEEEMRREEMRSSGQAFEWLYRASRTPWDTDGPSSFVEDLERSHLVRGDVLDAGCGTGENALFLAGRGYHVVAIDAAPTAIERAKTKASERRLAVDFQVADACDLTGYVERFDTVIDSGLFHVFDEESDRLRYSAALRRACRAAAALFVLALRGPTVPGAARLRRLLKPLARWVPIAGCGTHMVSEAELRRAFADGWLVEAQEERVEHGRQFTLTRLRRK